MPYCIENYRLEKQYVKKDVMGKRFSISTYYQSLNQDPETFTHDIFFNILFFKAVILNAVRHPKIFLRPFFGYEQISSSRGVREFRCAPVDQKRTKKVKAPISLFKNFHKR